MISETQEEVKTRLMQFMVASGAGVSAVCSRVGLCRSTLYNLLNSSAVLSVKALGRVNDYLGGFGYGG